MGTNEDSTRARQELLTAPTVPLKDLAMEFMIAIRTLEEAPAGARRSRGGSSHREAAAIPSVAALPSLY
jgi:hypothetical protein